MSAEGVVARALRDHDWCSHENPKHHARVYIAALRDAGYVLVGPEHRDALIDALWGTAFFDRDDIRDLLAAALAAIPQEEAT